MYSCALRIINMASTFTKWHLTYKCINGHFQLWWRTVSAARSGLYNYGCLVDVNATRKRNAPYDSESYLAFCNRLPWSTYTDPSYRCAEEAAALTRRIL
jgi:hypothetical protein